MEWLLQQDEKALVGALKRTYFYQVQRRGVPLMEADFRQGLDRLLPTTHSGTQSQETWQRHRLRATMPDLKLPASVCVEKIGNLLKSRFAQMKLMDEPLWHVPCRRWSKDLIAEAQELLSLDGQSFSENLGGSRYTLLRKDVSDPGKLRTDGLVGRRSRIFSPGGIATSEKNECFKKSLIPGFLSRCTRSGGFRPRSMPLKHIPNENSLHI